MNSNKSKQKQSQIVQKKQFNPDDYVTAGTSREEVLDIKQAFDHLDKDGSGIIDPQELRDAFSEMGLLDNNRLIYHILASIDEDCSGGIDFNEFMKVATLRFSEKTTMADAQKVFNYFDPDQDEKVTLLELKRMGASLGETLTHEQYAEMFRRADLDGDGFVTVEDFYNILTGKVYHD